MGNLSKRTEGCSSCKWTDVACDKVKRLQGSECPDYEKRPNKNMFTCFKCKDNTTCEFAWDLYNLNGDCLAIK